MVAMTYGRSVYGDQGDPATDAFAITPSDVAEFTYVTRAIYVGGTGNITVIMQDGTQVLFAAVPTGYVLPVKVRQVLATGTTATNLVGLI